MATHFRFYFIQYNYSVY